MSAKPWFPFFPSDWKADDALRMCSPGARALWLEMLCVMHGAEPRGHLLVNGKPVSNAQMAMLSALPLADVNAWMTELEDAAVFSRDPSGALFSRKMVRDSKKSQEQADKAAKRWGGNADGNASGNASGIAESHAETMPQIPIPYPHPELKERDKESLSTRDADFQRFWAAYPKKTAKPKAAKAFAQAMKRTDIRAMLAGLDRAKASDQWRRDGGKYIPHPASWLNQDRWADDDGESPALPFDPDGPLPDGWARKPDGTPYNRFVPY